MKDNELIPWIAFIGADVIFNHGKILRSMIEIMREIQKEKEEKLKSLDNDCFGC